MIFSWRLAVLCFMMIGSIYSHPTKELKNRDLLSSIAKLRNGIKADVEEFKGIGESIIQLLQSVAPTYNLSTPEGVHSYLGQFQQKKEELIKGTIDIVSQGLGSGDIIEAIQGFSKKINSPNNVNTKEPEKSIYPLAGSDDAPYSIPEESLRAAMHIPQEFEYGNGSKSPVILVPGTFSNGGLVYASNYAKLLKETDFADVLWLNVPGSLLDDAQTNAEYVAYAINYISGISNDKNVSVISWSQGGLDTQWALKYWPSTRSKVSNFIPISPDFKGTKMVYAICPSYPAIPCSPSVLQQQYNSTYIKTLRDDGGDSAYVPTTSIYSGFDEIVEPQSGDDASAIMNDERDVGVTNNQFQIICPNKLAGKYYTHEGALYNPVGYALAVDALTQGGPGQISRIDLDTECNKIVPDDLTDTDILATEALLPEALLLYFGYHNKTTQMPDIKSYAQ